MFFNRKGTRTRRLAGLMVCLAMVGAATSAGCSRAKAPQAKKDLEKLKEKKPQRPFEELRVFTEPNERSSFEPKAKETSRVVAALKPGHWTGVLMQTTANLSDFSGQLASEPLNSERQPVDLERNPFRLSTSRVVALPKGQRKTFETLFFAPRPDPTSTASKGSTWIGSKLRDAHSGAGVESSELVPHMPSFQYYMVVLARNVDRFRYLKVLDSVRPPMEYAGPNVDDTSYYRVLFPRPGEPVALPTEPLCWTSIAYVVWDDQLPAILSTDQQRAMVDWLHWGGGLIISGPDTLDKLRGTFLDAYLPATAASAGPLDPAKLAELHDAWTLSGDEGRALGTRPAAAWSGVELVKHPQAEFLPGTAQMVAERRVGRGRVVVTAFRLSEPELLGWRSYDSFFNACILRRPPRKFEEGRDRVEFVGPGALEWLDPAVASNVRFFARDVRVVQEEPDPQSTDSPNAPSLLTQASAPATPMVDAYGQVLNEIDQAKAGSGVAAWNDFGLVSTAARRSLMDAAGISVPKRTFVLSMIGLYLLVVVVINWLVFRLAGRVEWAWVAVPVIAVTWGVLVVWLAQLDIGFARSETEVAVLEVQPGYGRGHLSRYTALYSSLSTNYDVHFDDPSAVAMPFSADRQMFDRQVSTSVTFTAVGDRNLSGFPVASNSTGMIHSEQMFDLGGDVVWDAPDGRPPTVANNTKLKLSGVTIVRRRLDADGRSIDESAWLGDLEPGSRVAVQFQGHDAAELDAARRSDPLSSDNPPDGALSLRRLIDVAEDHDSLAPGEVRLVAWHDGRLAGIEVSPTAKQGRRATLVVANLEFGDGPVPRPDENLRANRPPPQDLL